MIWIPESIGLTHIILPDKPDESNSNINPDIIQVK